MSEERALELFARCWNRQNFDDVLRRLHRRSAYRAYNRIYLHEGRQSVGRALAEKAAELRAAAPPLRAYKGFLMSRHDLVDLPRCDRCVVLTRDDPAQAIGIVRIRCSLFRIREIRVLDPANCNFTRGNYCGKE